MPQVENHIDLIKQICEHQPESTVWVKPVWKPDASSGNEKIVDFQFHYCNPASKRVSGANDLLGRYILADKLPDPGADQLIFDQCLKVYETGEPLEYSYFSQTLDKFLVIQRVKVLDGVLSTIRNHTEEYFSQLEKKHQARLLKSLIDNSPYGISLYESVRDTKGSIIDFKLKVCNKKGAELTGLPMDVLYTKTLKELIQLRGHSNYIEICVNVVETGQPYYTEFYYALRNIWLGFSIVKFEDGYLLNYIDITERKKYELEAKANAHELDAIFNGSLSGVYTVSVLRNEAGKVYDFVFLRVNEGFYKMFPNSTEQIIGQSLLSISHTDDQSEFIQYANEVIQTGESFLHVIEYQNPQRWYEFSMVKLDNETICITVNDITFQKQSSIEIERQRALLDNIMRQSPNGLSVTKAIRDESGKMVDAISVLMNDACEKLNGLPNEVLLTNTMGSLSPELLESPVFKAALELKTGEAFRTEYYLPQTGRWLELAVAKMDEDHFINVFTDISAVKEVQQQLEKTVADLKVSNANLEEFAYAASHDLKEPIRKILFFTERLKTQYDAVLDESGKATFGRLELAAERMGQLIDDLLEYSHVNQGAGEMETVDMQLKVSKVMVDLELAIQEKEAQIIIDTLPVIKGNKRQVQQLFQNLIGNAIKYSKPGVPPQIHITAKPIVGKESGMELPPEAQEHLFHFISISDNGIGFGQADAERIFNVFTRLHGNTEYKGTGVGLSIVRKVVKNHNGFIQAESQLGVGATFKILLPAEK